MFQTIKGPAPAMSERRSGAYRASAARSTVSLLVSFLGGLLVAGCASASRTPSGGYAAADFSLVLLRTGSAPEGSTEALTQGQFDFMNELAEQGKLLIAGPFGPDKDAEDLIGIFLLDEPDVENARELGGGDPLTQAGVLRQEVLPLTTLDVIRVLPSMETARQRRREAEGADMEKPDIRAYTILTAPDGPRAARSIFQHPAIGSTVVLMARMRAPREDELFAILDVPTAAELRARLEVANEDGIEVHISEWYGSPVIAELAQRGE
ncbi:YCII-related domain protein [Planctomycetes bacterium Poly30]|uniref:YCII-related domain protein n=1 Tax=Saltatorellus ferox TaxID=2528018 RepID=A0A518EUC8_9BACT|nr:YCII-related domain protein [Planctomycetes bacterium Poly30]